MGKLIGAGLAALYRETDTADTYGDAIELYDPLPEISISSGENSDTKTSSKIARTRAGITTVGPLTFKVKTTSAELENIIADRKAGTERKWKFAIPSESATATGDVDEFILTAWVKDVKYTPSMEDETMFDFTLNINDLEGEE